MLRDKRVVFGGKLVVFLMLLSWNRPSLALDAVESIEAPIVAIGGDLDPLPAFGAKLFRFGFQLFGDEPVEQGNVREIALMLGLE